MKVGACGWGQGYFETAQKAEGQLCLEGRRWYRTPQKESGPKVSLTLVPMLRAEERFPLGLFQEYNGQTFDLSSLICQNSQAQTTQEVLAYLHQCMGVAGRELGRAEPSPSCCTKVGYRMAQCLSRVAATRIFADPEQSLMELPVNSLDAYNPSQKIGKFGLGFFSIFYWLIGHPRRFLLLTSFSESQGRYCTYQMTIREVHEKLTFKLDLYDSEVRRTGAYLELNAERDHFSKVEAEGFQRQILKLQYTTSAALWVPADRGDWQLLNKGEATSPKKVFLESSRAKFWVEDYATGIPLSVALGSLLLPSVSTKTLQASQNQPIFFASHSRVEIVHQGAQSGFVILVAGIAVVRLNRPEAAQRHLYLIDMPSNTKVPVSRDDILLTPETEPIFASALRTVLTQAYELRVLVELQQYLKTYLALTASDVNKKAVEKARDQFVSEKLEWLVPLAEYRIYLELSLKFIASEVYDPLAIEKTLAQFPSDNQIWYGKKVIILDTLDSTGATWISDGGLISYLFVARKYTKSHPKDWPKLLAMCYVKTKLGPVRSTVGLERHEGYLKELEDLGKVKISNENIQLYLALRAKFDSLRVYCTIEPHTSHVFVKNLLFLYGFCGATFFTNLAQVLLEVFSRFEGSSTYGAQKNVLKVPQVIDRVVIHTDRGRENYQQSILLSLQVTEEKPTTELQFDSRLNPQGLRTLLDLSVEDLHQARSLTELTYAALALTGMSIVNRKPSELRASWMYALKLVRERNLTYRDLKTLYLVQAQSDGKLVPLDVYYLQIAMKDWDQTVNSQGELPVERLPESASKPISFQCSQLISYLLYHDLPFQGSDKEYRHFFQEVAKSDIPQPFQTLEIAINEGTTKPYIQAMTTELVQNSVDAIREFDPKMQSIHMRLATTKDHSSIIWSITDFVGMSPEAFVYVKVPFLSTKKPSKMVTGEMGTGFFNVYRESSVVIVQAPGWFSYETPIYTNGRVTDVLQEVSRTHDQGYTTITVVTPTPTLDRYLEVLSAFQWHLRNVLGLISIPLRLNGTSINVPKIELTIMGHWTIYLAKDVDASVESYVLTKGIPFAPLQPYLKQTGLQEAVIQENNTGVFLEVGHGGYLPVQTRTRLQMTEPEEAAFKVAMNWGIFGKTLYKVARGQGQHLIPNMESDSDVSALSFSNYHLDPQSGHSSASWLMYMDLEGSTLAAMLNACMQVLGKERYADLKQWKLDEIQAICMAPKLSPTVGQMIHEVAVKWLTPKNARLLTKEPKKTPTPKKGVRGGKKGKAPKLMAELIKTISTTDPKAQKLLEPWVSAYVKLGRQLKIVGYPTSGAIPKVVVEKDIELNIKGLYIKASNTILIITKGWSRPDRKVLKKTLRSKPPLDWSEALAQNGVWNDCLALSYPATTIAHELEHYRRKDSHEGTHDQTFSKLAPNDVPKKRTFEQSANWVYEAVITEGFYEEFLKLWKA